MTINPNDLVVISQVALAAVLGLMIGAERESSHKPAGFRTYSLIAMGSALFTVLSFQLTGPYIDPTRIAAQVLTGIGFIGAGLIFTRGDQVFGLTSAATIWVTAAIGMAVGFKMYVVAIAATILTLVILYSVRLVEQKLFDKNAEYHQ
jgi:putative Mg2+ transporter-C (MgtC) family protein